MTETQGTTTPPPRIHALSDGLRRSIVLSATFRTITGARKRNENASSITNRKVIHNKITETCEIVEYSLYLI
ncbi:MAG TPA: hypothetical protein VM511_08830, partial [Luteolibacter sp.]|nr:hypothetical protein [Luteolibacter sp.]